MKIIALHSNEKQLIKKSIKGDQQAQKLLYDKFSPKMLGVCRQYIKDLHFAEDVMINGFVKVFNHLNSYQHKGSFEGWIRTIMVRESISYLRKRQFVVYDDDAVEVNGEVSSGNDNLLDVEYVQYLIDELPEGYKAVFLLYAIEGYGHKEIAELLEISVGTSKSQLFKARKMLQENLSLNGMSPKSKSASKK
ncbi:RNA polymerase, sigma-24 subunit, ECF subfamily [Allomuricauda ruestringensis DSM 13258]|uniref:RNA polymerase, sigma-24 subunit, ECF subfamily n=1 Tax=Allomuricauda ruestringensis (strain DSM 13258 / CIP 107369 / LMG 19739 / B1) TaxID=886377 RepID=G2PL01_ALLRU|nr:RNA polymerase sigma factor [Allomuricauda ruestringensis]AEM71030.1 RNA polymerase, sigma-24 subunit, ECF subfamily [Allomuricauda ruestringensis DSM 13258]